MWGVRIGSAIARICEFGGGFTGSDLSLGFRRWTSVLTSALHLGLHLYLDSGPKRGQDKAGRSRNGRIGQWLGMVLVQ